jgi:hypothetical protein
MHKIIVMMHNVWFLASGLGDAYTHRERERERESARVSECIHSLARTNTHINGNRCFQMWQYTTTDEVLNPTKPKPYTA